MRLPRWLIVDLPTLVFGALAIVALAAVALVCVLAVALLIAPVYGVFRLITRARERRHIASSGHSRLTMEGQLEQIRSLPERPSRTDWHSL
jgi:hypothetical protein